ILASCHTANVCAQTNQLRRWVEYKGSEGTPQASAEIMNLGMGCGGIAALIAGSLVARRPLPGRPRPQLGAHHSGPRPEGIFLPTRSVSWQDRACGNGAAGTRSAWTSPSPPELSARTSGI
ncbi:unnamed protein product, partial [Prorocentrum cordatum]